MKSFRFRRIFLGGAGLKVNLDMFLVEPLRQIADRERCPLFSLLDLRVDVLPNLDESLEGKTTRLVRCDCAKSAKAHPSRGFAETVLKDELLAAGWEHANAETGQLAIPDEIVLVLDLERLDLSLRQLWQIRLLLPAVTTWFDP